VTVRDAINAWLPNSCAGAMHLSGWMQPSALAEYVSAGQLVEYQRKPTNTPPIVPRV
jgi:hypothetical protein